jgi:hypothetical protein
MNYSEDVVRKHYSVKTAPKHKAFFGGVFGKDKHPLCEALGPNQIPECEHAVAATGWKFELGEELYNADGKKQIVKCNCDIEMLLPQWKTMSVNTENAEMDKVHRFLSATDTHERGHATACRSLAQITKLLAENMPDTVQPHKRSQFNGAFNYFVHQFYKVLAKEADVLFDEYTRHGGMYEAQLSDGEDSTDTEDLEFMFDDTLPGEVDDHSKDAAQ